MAKRRFWSVASPRAATAAHIRQPKEDRKVAGARSTTDCQSASGRQEPLWRKNGNSSCPLTHLVLDSGKMVPRKVFFTKGVGVHKEKLASFEMALRVAGLAHCNLVLVSSI